MVDERPLIYAPRSSIQLTSNKAAYQVSSIGQVVGALYMTRLSTDSGEPVDTYPLDLEPINGLTHPSPGIKTPWNSVLFSEVNLVDAKKPQAFAETYKPYFKHKVEQVNPYHYGWLAELGLLEAEGSAKVIKNYAVGRLFAAHVLAMPDQKSLYLLDSEYSGNLYLFIADEEGSFSKGSLYVVHQKGNAIKYKIIGKESALRIKFKLKKIKFSDLFSVQNQESGQCQKNHVYIKTVYGEECLLLKNKNKRYAGLFDPIRVTSLMGINGFLPSVDGMEYDSSSNQIKFYAKGQVKHISSLGESIKPSSQYLIKGLQ
ncbi:MAG: hypothetical protein MJA28_00485 [Gammaproteobacteria bacterium]|nr:hypothetical protein [Gammaproteobacteria bacterium]